MMKDTYAFSVQNNEWFMHLKIRSFPLQ